MSIVRRTIEAFPRGRTTEELVILLGAAFDQGKRRAILAELGVLAQTGVIRMQRNGRWTSVAPPQPTDPRGSGPSGPVSGAGPEELLVAVPATIASEPVSAGEDIGQQDAPAAVDPQALLRYWRSALRSDPRGAITQSPDRHGAGRVGQVVEIVWRRNLRVT